jgi:Mg/Co/Ni transporter MgtE
MTMGTRVYLARLAGLPVFDPNGDRVGRVRDAVVRLRTTNRPPQVVGLVAEMALRRRIFLPIGRVTSMDADAVVLATGMLNLRRFEKRPNELLVVEDLLDRRVTVVPEDGSENRTPATVVDISMEQNRSNEWLVKRVGVRELTGRLTRRGHVFQADLDRVLNLFGPTDTQGTSNLIALLEQMKPADMANALQDLPDTRRNEVAAALSDRQLADVLEELPEHDQVELLDLMEPEEAAPVRQLMNYQPGTAGAVMTSEPVIMTPDATVAEALARIREPELSAVVAAQVFVARAPSATPTGRYLGMVHFQRLLREPPSSILGGIVDNDIEPLRPATPLGAITKQMATYDLVAMPVIDQTNRLVGAVTVDDVLDHTLPRDWRDKDAAEAAEAAELASAALDEVES